MHLAELFRKCRSEKRAAVMPFLTSGYPTDKIFIELLRGMIRAGADLIEIGVPFSDPLADGKSIQKSSETALANGVTIDRTLRLAERAVRGQSVPLVLMSYYNPILSYGLERLLKRMARSNFRGLIIPDLVLEEGAEMEELCRRHGVDLIYLLAPTSNRERRLEIIRRTGGFVYLVSVAGVTGARQVLPRKLKAWIRRVKKESTHPVCVGFGISSQRQIREISGAADGIIIGSALVEIINRAPNRALMIKNVESFISGFRKQVERATTDKSRTGN
jgi:tryptophan synthase alpha chain